MTDSNDKMLKTLGIEVGTKTHHAKIITEADVLRFADACGDYNPVHISEEFAKKTRFGSRIVHGVLTLGLISAAIAKLPGLAIYLSQTIKFVSPVYIGDSITAIVEVTKMNEVKRILYVRTTCINENDEIVLDGEAKVKIFQSPS